MPSTFPAHAPLYRHHSSVCFYNSPATTWLLSSLHTHPSIIALQQWTRAELSEDSVTVHNGLMADAVREFTGSPARTYVPDNTHTHLHWKQTGVGYNLMTESQTDNIKWTVRCKQCRSVNVQIGTSTHTHKSMSVRKWWLASRTLLAH